MMQPLSYTAQARALLALGLPLIGSHLAQMALHVTDTVLLGWYGVNELAAVVLALSIADSGVAGRDSDRLHFCQMPPR